MLAFASPAPLRLNMAWRTSRVALKPAMNTWARRRTPMRACASASAGERPEMPEISEEIVRKTAQLASLELSEGEISPVTEQFKEIIALFNKMNEVDVEGVEPMARPQHVENVMRSDEPKRFDDVDGIMEEVPVVENDFVRVPKISSESDN